MSALLALRADVGTATVVRALRAARVESLLLKGAAVDRWLYPDGARRYDDVDLLVPRERMGEAMGVLERLGMRRSEFPAAHAEYYEPPPGSPLAPVDLHHTFHGIAVPCWDALTSGAGTIELAGEAVAVPRPAAQALIVALHLAEHGLAAGQQRQDVERAVALAGDAAWREAGETARELGVLAACAAAVRAVAGGAALADRLGWPTEVSSGQALKLQGAPATGAGMLTLLESRSARGALSLLARELVPPARQLREHHPLARRGRAGLALVYLGRPAHLLRRAPAALRAARRARRYAASSG